MFNVYERVFIENFNSLGYFKIDWIDEKKQIVKTSCEKPVIAESDDENIFYTGFLSVNSIFNKSPFSIIYCQFSSLELNEIDQFNRNVLFKLDIHDKNFTFIRSFLISYKNKYVSIDFEPLNYIINFFNRVISKDYEIKAFPEEIDYNIFPLNIDDIILGYFNKLSFKKFSCSSNRGPGKDSAFWDEIVITNLPKQQYLIEIMTSIIRNKIYGDFKYNNNSIIIKGSTDYGFVSAGDEKPTELDVEKDRQLILDVLKINIFKNFDIDRFIVEYIESY